MRRSLPFIILPLGLWACQDAHDPLAPEVLPATSVASAGSARVPGQYIVVFKEGTGDIPGRAQRLTAAHGGRLRYVWDRGLQGFSAEIPERAAVALARLPEVAYVWPNEVIRVQTSGTQSNPPWGLDRVDERSLPQDNSYTYPFTGNGVRAYVIDTGVRLTHSEFGGRATSGWDFADNDADASDCMGHGTHVAGSLAGATYGVAKGVSVVSVRVFDCFGNTTTDKVVSAVNWVTNNAVRPAVANMSLGGSANPPIDDAVRASIASRVAYVVSAGNDSVLACNRSPARVAQALTVGAIRSGDQEAWFSNWGTCVDLLAPGVEVLSAYKNHDFDSKIDSGTSMAAPHVAGAAAMYLEWRPAATAAEVHSAITNGASLNKITMFPGRSGTPNRLLFTRFIGWGATISGPTNVGHNQYCSWTATVTSGEPPYSYYWSAWWSSSNTGFYFTSGQGTANVTGWGYYYNSYPDYTTINMTLSVTDAAGQSVSVPRNVSLHYYLGGCY